MPVDVVELDQDESDKLLAYDEGHFVDLKAIEIAPSKLTKAISAFANADGGDLYIGIDEDTVTKVRQWRGFASPEDANAHLQVFQELFPLGRDFDYEFFRSPYPGLVLHLSVRKTRDIKKSSDGTVYLRRGAQSLPVKASDALADLSRAKGITSFETETVNAPLETVTNSETIISFLLEIIPTVEPVQWLTKQLLINQGLPTVAALLLFGDEPQVALPKRSAIKLYRYKTTDPEGTRETLAFDPLTIEGPLYEQIHRAVSETAAVVQATQITGSEGLQEITYPHETLHEIITNAVIHRDYSLADDVHVRVFDNRVEVESPGRLPAHVTPANILQERFARNGVIVRLINKFPSPPNKDVGEGLNTAFAAMKALKLKDPIIEELANSVLVNIRHERLASPEELIIDYLKSNDEVTNSVVRGLTGIGSENKVKRIFEGMIKNRQIERIPEKRGAASAYRRASGDGSST